MKSLSVACITALLVCSGTAFASSSYSTGDTISDAVKSVSESVSSTSGEDKVVLAARDDAASFVASEGAIRSSQLEAAFRRLRERTPQAREASDAELAKAILAL